MKIKPRRLTWPEINRVMEVLSNSPCHSKEGDGLLIDKTHLIKYYDEDDTENVEAVEGADEAFFDYTPNPRVKDAWRPSAKAILPCEEGALMGEAIREKYNDPTIQEKMKYDQDKFDL